MDALIALEEAAASEAFASAGASKRAVPGAAKEPKSAKRAKAKAQPEPEPAFEEEDWDDDDDDDDDDELDEELEENGSYTPVAVTDPASDAAAGALVERRVFLDGVPGRSDLRCSGATICGWRSKKRQWEVECDRGDERLLVSSKYMYFLDLAPEPPPARTKKAPREAKKAPREAKKAPREAKPAPKAKGIKAGLKKIKKRA